MIQKVLIVDDEPDIRELLELTLGRMNLETTSAGDLKTAKEFLKQQDFHLCLTDMNLPDGDGIDFVKDIQKNYPQIPVAIITAHGSTETAIKALKSGAFDFFSKPINLGDLRTVVSSALKLNDNTPADKGNFNIIGESKEIQTLKQQISKLARSQAPVFINGESGSGKELVARAIHFQGPRKDNKFVAINCGAIPSELMESEFFGHKKGSFTGADKDKIGLFQAASGGSLFLDEVADLPLHMQVKLLRAIQEKSVRPIGAQEEIAVDIRLISATHKDLNQQVDEGHLRQDFFYRINVIELKVPNLQERTEDIPLLVEHILKKHAQEHSSDSEKLSPLKIDKQALIQLQQRNYPGNIRELENILQRASALAENNLIRCEDLPDNIVPTAPPSINPPLTINNIHEPANNTDTKVDIVEGFSLENHLENIEKQIIEQALTETRWNKTAAAKKLGMSFRSFRYRVKKLGLE